MDATGRDRLGAFLEKAHLSDASFARLLGVESSTVWRWRTGKRQPSIAAAAEIERLTKGHVKLSAWAPPAAKTNR